MAALEIFRSGARFDTSAPSIGRAVLPDSVPSGKRLVLETVTGYYNGDGAILGAAYLDVYTGGEFVSYGFPWVQCGGEGDIRESRYFYGFNHYVRIYIDGPASLQFDVDGGSFSGAASYSGTYAVSGHLIDLP
jgi:hypothetical protein